MVQVGNAATHNEKEVKRIYPVTSGLTAGTQKQEGRKMNLVPTVGSYIRKREKIGIS